MTTLATFPGLEVTPLPQFAYYPAYLLDLTFKPMPYPVLGDASLGNLTSSWTNAAGTPQSYTYIPEWIRYTDFDLQPAFSTIQQPKGGAKFNSSVAGVHGKQYTGALSLNLPDEILKIRWMTVPYRYITSVNSYLSRWVGRVNQADWPPANTGLSMPVFAKGSLLYLGWNAKKYTQPLQTAYAGPIANVYGVQKFADIEFTFAYTTRTLPAGETVNGTYPPSNANYIVAGHNLMPWMIDRRFHYVSMPDSSDALSTASASTWNSFPMELLFMDPDALVNGVIQATSITE